MPIVVGMDAFRDAMAGHEDKYVLIGGGACSLLFDGTSRGFRPTKDLDVVVMAASDDVEFGRALWTFVCAGPLSCGHSLKCFGLWLPAVLPSFSLEPLSSRCVLAASKRRASSRKAAAMMSSIGVSQGSIGGAA